MLITLASDVGGNANDFVNYFKETVQIEPNSEIAFVSIAYQFTNDGGGDREADVMLINIEEMGLKSICKEGGVQKAIGVVCYGASEQDATKAEGKFYYENYNLIYHRLENKGVENHNQLHVRLTDAIGVPLDRLTGQTVLTIDIRPRMS